MTKPTLRDVILLISLAVLCTAWWWDRGMLAEKIHELESALEKEQQQFAQLRNRLNELRLPEKELNAIARKSRSANRESYKRLSKPLLPGQYDN
jgi:septal ring factor EnvC (AmiA/AmiB activator)